MEIIIAMTVSFILGAYVRAPFKLFSVKKSGDERQPRGGNDEENQKITRQLNNLLSYGGEENLPPAA